MLREKVRPFTLATAVVLATSAVAVAQSGSGAAEPVQDVDPDRAWERVVPPQVAQTPAAPRWAQAVQEAPRSIPGRPGRLAERQAGSRAARA